MLEGQVDAEGFVWLELLDDEIYGAPEAQWTDKGWRIESEGAEDGVALPSARAIAEEFARKVTLMAPGAARAALSTLRGRYREVFRERLDEELQRAVRLGRAQGRRTMGG